MKPARFDYRRPASVNEAISLLAAEAHEAKLLAGGQSLVPLMNMRLARPSLLIDINRLPGLNEIRVDSDRRLHLGALLRHSDLIASSVVAHHAPLIAEAARHVGHRAIRNRGTLGGSLAHADPAAELCCALVALDAQVKVVRAGGERTIAAADLFIGPYTTALGADEIIVDVVVPSVASTAWGFAEVARRPGDFALAGVCCSLGEGRARIVAFGVGEVPLRLGRAESVISADVREPQVAKRAAMDARDECNPPDDLQASAGYRRHLVGVLTERVLLDAWSRSQRKSPTSG